MEEDDESEFGKHQRISLSHIALRFIFRCVAFCVLVTKKKNIATTVYGNVRGVPLGVATTTDRRTSNYANE